MEDKVATISRVTRKCVWYENDGFEHRKADEDTDDEEVNNSVKFVGVTNFIIFRYKK